MLDAKGKILEREAKLELKKPTWTGEIKTWSEDLSLWWIRRIANQKKGARIVFGEVNIF